MRPYIICHMMSSVDGRIDCTMTEEMEPSNIYYDALDKLECPTQLAGRVTMQMHFADGEQFVATDNTPLGKEAFHIAAKADGYSVAMDTHGKLRWPSNHYEGRPLLVAVCEDCAAEYLEALTRQGISWIATGKGSIDLNRLVETLSDNFWVRRMAVVGGGHINGGFLAAGLLDEVSVMIGSGIDGRKGMAAVFDGLQMNQPLTHLNLKSVERANAGTVWLRYDVVRH